MAKRDLTSVERHIVDVGHIRWAYPSSYYYWFVGGATNDAGIQDRMRYRLTRDLTTIQSSCRRKRITPVALLSETQVDDQLLELVKAMPGWKTLVFGDRHNGFAIPAAQSDVICCRSADLILCYGDPSDALTEIIDGLENPPTLIRRNMHNAGRVHQPLAPKQPNPYSRYWTDVERLKHYKPNPTEGLQIRDEIDMRPQFRV